MVLKPHRRDDLAAALSGAHSAGSQVARIDLSALDRLIEHKPEDMTATVEAGMTLAQFQTIARRHQQWLPIDPPHAERLALADVLAFNLSGPRRFGCGTIRDYLLGITVLLADGTWVRSGGKVVKNVAGYDLAKLFVGSRHSLCVIVEATFKLRPIPEEERLVQCTFNSIDDLATAVRRLLESPAEPVILDAHNLEDKLTLVAGFAGSREDVAYQLECARTLGICGRSSLDYERHFWSEGAFPETVSVLPSETARAIKQLGQTPFVSRWGNGTIYFRSDAQTPKVARQDHTPALAGLMARTKAAFDPEGILPEYFDQPPYPYVKPATVPNATQPPLP